MRWETADDRLVSSGYKYKNMQGNWRLKLWKCACIDQAGVVISLCLTYSREERSHAHLFDPRFDAVFESQLSGCSLTGAQNLTNLPVGEAILLCLQQQPFGYSFTVGQVSKGNFTSLLLTIPKPILHEKTLN